jgi:hypothetical protein
MQTADLLMFPCARIVARRERCATNGGQLSDRPPAEIVACDFVLGTQERRDALAGTEPGAGEERA